MSCVKFGCIQKTPRIRQDVPQKKEVKTLKAISIADEVKCINLNTHIIRVKNDSMDITFTANPVRPKIMYSKMPDARAPGAFILKTVSVDGLPQPKDNVIFIVNRDTISATRKIERNLRTKRNYNKIFKTVDAHPDNWREILKQKRADNANMPRKDRDMIKEALLYVERYDLRAPGEQVRDADNRISHCRELISEFE